MKLSKAEIASLITAAAFLALACGFIAGRSGKAADFTVYVERSAEEQELLTGRDAESYESSAADEPAGLVNINTAETDELVSLPGIGEVLAERIIAYREENGGFNSTDEIMAVYGIGESTFENIHGMICVGP